MLQKVNELIKRLETVENQYRPIPFWSWNGKLEKEELIRQIRWMRETHNGGFFMHARAGLEAVEVAQQHIGKVLAKLLVLGYLHAPIVVVLDDGGKRQA